MPTARPRPKPPAPVTAPIKQEFTSPTELLDLASMPRGRRVHGTADWAWLAFVVVALLAFILVWPGWDMLIGSEEANYWTILGVQRGADRGVIKRAYRDLAKKWHPDHNPGCGEECREQMRTLQQAYRTLLDNPEAAAPASEDTRGFHAQLLHFFLGNLFDMSFHFGEFVVCLIPAFPVSRWAAARAVVVVGAGITLYVFLSSVGVPLSWLGILICGYRFRKMASWELNVRAVGQQLNVLVYVVVPAALAFVLYWRAAVRGAFDAAFGLNLAAGVIYLSAFVIRFQDLNVFLTFQLKWVPKFGFRGSVWLLFQVACMDMLSYVMKIPPPFRIASHVLIFINHMQRWFYIRVKPTQTDKGPLLIVQDMPASSVVKKPSPDPTMLTQPKEKLTKEEKRLRVRAEDGAETESASRRVPCVTVAVIVIVSAIALLAPYWASRVRSAQAEGSPPPQSAPKPDPGKATGGARARPKAPGGKRTGGAAA